MDLVDDLCMGPPASTPEVNLRKKRKSGRKKKRCNDAEPKDGLDLSPKTCSMENDVKDPSHESQAFPKVEVNSPKKWKRVRKKKQRNDAEDKDEGLDLSLTNCSMETDLKDPSHVPQAFPKAEVNSSKKRKRDQKKKQCNDAEDKDEGLDLFLANCSTKTDVKDPSHVPQGFPKAEVNSSKNRKRDRKKKQCNNAEDKDEGLDLSLKNCSMENDASMKDLSHESQAFPDLLSSKSNVESDSTVKNIERKTKKMKKNKTRHNAIENSVNGCGTPENTFSSGATIPGLDNLSEHPIQCMSTDSVTRESCVEADICHGENVEKKHSIMEKATENSKKQCDALEVRCYSNSVVANAEFSAKEHVLEVVKFTLEQGVNDNSSKTEEKSGSVENKSMGKKHDEEQASNHSSDKFQVGKIYTRRKMVNYGSSGHSTVLDHHKAEDSHKFSNGELTVGLIERETKLSREQVTSDSGAVAEEMKLMSEKTSENGVMTSLVVDIPAVHLEEKNGRQLGHIETTSNDLCCTGDVSNSNLVTAKDGHSKSSKFSLGRTVANNSKNKLLILDINGLLADFVGPECRRCQPQPDFWLRTKKVYKRPFCDDFLQFCFDRFHVGIWSSRAKGNVDLAIKLLMGKSASKLLFCWNQSQCTKTKFTTVENSEKPLILKDLRKLWEKVNPNLPWKKGEFNESNTLLLDDSPYKALLNPMHTGVFPYSYRFHHTRDSSLGPGGDIRVYLEGLAMAENVQEYVSSHPFGQRPIREANPSWKYYLKVIEAYKGSQGTREVEDSQGTSAVKGSQGASCASPVIEVVKDSQGAMAVKGSQGAMAVKGSQGAMAVKGSQGASHGLPVIEVVKGSQDASPTSPVIEPETCKVM